MAGQYQLNDRYTSKAQFSSRISFLQFVTESENHREVREMGSRFDEKDFLACCGSTRFAKEMAAAAPFSDCDAAVVAARDIWFNKVLSLLLSLYEQFFSRILTFLDTDLSLISQVDVNGWLEAFSAHPQIGQLPSQNHKSPAFAQLFPSGLYLSDNPLISLFGARVSNLFAEICIILNIHLIYP